MSVGDTALRVRCNSYGDALVVQAGGKDGKSIVGFSARTGETVWSHGDGAVNYQSPAMMTLAGQRQIVAASGKKITGLSADDGEVHSRGNWWFSPDIWVRQEADGGLVHQDPQAGAENTFYVRLRNRGETAVSGELLVRWLPVSYDGQGGYETGIVSRVAPEVEQEIIGKVIETWHGHPFLRGADLADELAGTPTELAVRIDLLCRRCGDLVVPELVHADHDPLAADVLGERQVGDVVGNGGAPAAEAGAADDRDLLPRGAGRTRDRGGAAARQAGDDRRGGAEGLRRLCLPECLR